MASQVITVLIVDDDPVVTATLRAHVSGIPGFAVTAVAHTGHEAIEAARRFRPALVLLDLHLPDLPGLTVAHHLRAPGQSTADVIVITGRQDLPAVRAAMQSGALHYLVKPVRLVTLERTLRRYAVMSRRLSDAHPADQQDIDRIFRSLHSDDEDRPKNISAQTSQLVLDVLTTEQRDLSADETAKVLGISRVTARRYLEYLASRSLVEVSLRYGPTGRPQHRYRVRAR